MEPKEIKISVNELDLNVIQAALLFLKANLDDYNELRGEFEEPLLSEEQVQKVYESIF